MAPRTEPAPDWRGGRPAGVRVDGAGGSHRIGDVVIGIAPYRKSNATATCFAILRPHLLWH
eukprot:6788908-Pyramimonas_sp.AAC.1